jgi:hypothetical protein
MDGFSTTRLATIRDTRNGSKFWRSTLQLELFQSSDTEYKGKEGKVCNKCKQFLPLSAFSRCSAANYLRPECKSCNNKLSKVRQEIRDSVGNPPEDYICPICLGNQQDVSGKGNNRNGSWVIDHDHETDTFRGWLCHACNRGLGCFHDSIEVLQRAIGYLNDDRSEDK